MIDPLRDTVLSLPAAARLLPRLTAGKPVHVSTVARWTKHGLRGVRLRSLKIGGRLVTSTQALEDFFQELTSRDGLTAGDRPRNPKIAARQEQIEAELKGKFGI